MKRVEVIAEAASCHDGSLDKALRLIGTAKGLGASTVKFQFWSNPDRLADLRRVGPDYRAIFHRYAMPEAWLPVLAAEASAQGLEFLCTIYLAEDLPIIAPFVTRFKVASFEASDAEFLQAVMAYGRPILASTGMHSDSEVGDLIRRLGVGIEHEGTGRLGSGGTLLHCTSAYPCPPEAANLRVLHIPRHPRIICGFSDHTRSPLAGAVAVGAGARVVEFHLRLYDTDTNNPDFAVSRSPGEARIYVENIRQAEVLMGDGEKRVMPEEGPMLAYKRQG